MASNHSGTNHNSSNGDVEPDVVMMTPLKKEIDHTILRVQRASKYEMNGGGDSATRHVAGGQHQGIIINKQLPTGADVDASSATCDLRLSFKVFLINAITHIHQQESRELRFWFADCERNENARLQCARAFFRALVNPSDFPKSYVAFIMKLMKTMQRPVYRPLAQIELEVRFVDEPFERPPSSSRPSKHQQSILIEPCVKCQHPVNTLPDLIPGNVHTRKRTPPPIPPKPKTGLAVSVDDNALSQMVPLSEDRVLEMIEAAYPNPLSLPDISAATCSKEEEVHHLVMELVSKGVAKITDLGQVLRVTSDETQVKRVRQMPKVIRSQQPTIAIITAQFCEKLAVDAMIENKDTYVRYKVEGESNVYTLGNIGPHRVVATKLPAVGNSRSAMIAAGNTTTRLLGIFQHVEYVFLVGIGGGVPHYTDYKQHVRLGDVVVSYSPNQLHSSSPSSKPNRSDYIYVHCKKSASSPDEPLNASNSIMKELQTVDSFTYRLLCPLSLELQEISRQILEEAGQTNNRPWEQYLLEAKEKLHESDDLDFVRPDPSTDKLYMSIGTGDLIEMTHPKPDSSDEYDARANGMPVIHFGAIGSGRLAVGNEQLRQDIAIRYGIKAFDIEFDTVIDSIFGNRKDRYIIIRGIADYKDGARKKDWQPYSALSAAAFMKAILYRLEPILVSDQ